MEVWSCGESGGHKRSLFLGAFRPILKSCGEASNGMGLLSDQRVVTAMAAQAAPYIPFSFQRQKPQ